MIEQSLGNPFPQGIRHPISSATVGADYGLASSLEVSRLGMLDRGFDSALDCFDRGLHKRAGLTIVEEAGGDHNEIRRFLFEAPHTESVIRLFKLRSNPEWRERDRWCCWMRRRGGLGFLCGRLRRF